MPPGLRRVRWSNAGSSRSTGHWSTNRIGKHNSWRPCSRRWPTVTLVLTDLLMPEQEGLETIQQLRTMTPAPKIIAISGGGYTGRRDCLRAAAVLGAARTFRKPLRARDLLTTVQALLAETSARADG